MAFTYAKLDSEIIASTVWLEPHTTFRVWICLLARKDQYGRVYGSIPGIAHLCRVTLEECRTAFDAFLSPDPYSRTKDYDGRRIEEIDGGWRILNSDKFRDRVDQEHQKRRHAKNQAAYRERQKGSSDRSLDHIADHAVTGDRKLPHTDSDTDTKQSNTLCSEHAIASSEPPVAFLPLISGVDFPITQKRADEWKAAYPAVDVMQALLQMKSWLNSNPKKRKTKNGILRFADSWLAREQDRGGGKPTTGRKQTAESFSNIDYRASYGLTGDSNVGSF